MCKWQICENWSSSGQKIFKNLILRTVIKLNVVWINFPSGNHTILRMSAPTTINLKICVNLFLLILVVISTL